MEQHFRFKASLPQVAYLTGRNLATFKRDCRQLFHTFPAAGCANDSYRKSIGC